MIHVGTSGWSYPHWVGTVYPKGTRNRDFFRFYADIFQTVELNTTFYRLPTQATVATWRKEAPPRFTFACKASRYITHMKKLKDPGESTPSFFKAIRPLGEHLGPILFQLPPRWTPNETRLRAFLEALPDGFQYAFEFRDERWFAAGIYDLLTHYNAAFCQYDLGGKSSPKRITADFVYIRLHGPSSAYGGSYDRTVLDRWARRFAGWAEGGLAVWCYFDNDEKGYAVANARALVHILGESAGPDLSRT